MSIAIIVGRDKEERAQYEWFTTAWKETLLALDPNLNIEVYPHIKNKDDITSLLVWNHEIGSLKTFKNAKGIFSLAAGVDHVLVDPEIDPAIPLTRVVDPFMRNDIVQYVTAYVLQHVKRLKHWEEKQKERVWYKLPPFSHSDKTIGIMGLGFLGSYTAAVLSSMGLKVIGYSKTKKEILNVETFCDLDPFLTQTDILVCMLPLTSETKGILNKNTFKKLKPGAFLINLGRGQHLNEKDLLDTLDQGHLSLACLDVFETEPLPTSHPFWVHENIIVTPHIASVTNPSTAGPQVYVNICRLAKGEMVLNRVDLLKGY